MTDIRPELIKCESDMHHFECLPCCRHEHITDGGPEFPGRGFSLVAAEVSSFLCRILSENKESPLFWAEYGGIQNTNCTNWIPVYPSSLWVSEQKQNGFFLSTAPQPSLVRWILCSSKLFRRTGFLLVFSPVWAVGTCSNILTPLQEDLGHIYTNILIMWTQSSY